MKKLLLICILVLMISCGNSNITYDGKLFSDYDMYVDYSINHLKSPVILKNVTKYVSKSTNDTLYDIMVIDRDNTIKYYTRYSDMANMLGEKYNIGDTIR